jgi:hypothetical protein
MTPSAAPGLWMDVLGVGLCGPGLPTWAQALPILRGDAPHLHEATVVAPPARLPATERRRAGVIIKVSINAADEALAQSGLQAGDIATVFSASEGDGKNCHELCEALALPDRLVSPTRFTNSVHNAAAGYWHIATKSMAPSTSLCALDASFGEGLMEAALQAHARQGPVMLVVGDQPYPQPLHTTRPLVDAMAVALILAPAGTTTASAAKPLTRWGLAWSTAASPVTTCSEPSLESLRQALPSARGLPLLQRLANATATPPRASMPAIVLSCQDDTTVTIA